MTGPKSISAVEFKQALLLAGDRISAARDELCALDAAAGDGDLGATLATGFRHAQASLRQVDGRDTGAVLVQLGVELARKAPSTIGALLASAFLRAGKALEGQTELGAPEIATLLHAAAAGVTERGGAAPGQRTIVDAMVAAADAAATESAKHSDAIETLRAGAVGARAGAKATADMEPQLGRAGWIKDRARGSQDAGAAAWAVFVTALDEACRDAGAPTTPRQFALNTSGAADAAVSGASDAEEVAGI